MYTSVLQHKQSSLEMASGEGVDNGGGENPTTVESREWVMAAYVPDGVPSSDHLKLRAKKISLDVSSIPNDHVAVELLWVSVDPYLRGRMSGQNEGLYFSQFTLDEVHILHFIYYTTQPCILFSSRSGTGIFFLVRTECR